jgi:hypothetical protein
MVGGPGTCWLSLSNSVVGGWVVGIEPGLGKTWTPPPPWLDGRHRHGRPGAEGRGDRTGSDHRLGGSGLGRAGKGLGGRSRPGFVVCGPPLRWVCARGRGGPRFRARGVEPAGARKRPALPGCSTAQRGVRGGGAASAPVHDSAGTDCVGVRVGCPVIAHPCALPWVHLPGEVKQPAPWGALP